MRKSFAMDIRKALQQAPKDRWKAEMAAPMPEWVNSFKPCSVTPTAVGACLSFVCRCTVTADKPRGKTVQVHARWRKGDKPPRSTQADLLRISLESKHGKGTCYDLPTALDPALQQQIIAKATAVAKRKQAEVGGLQLQLNEKKAVAVAELQPQLDELKHRRQAATKAANKHAVPIDSNNQTDFADPRNKKGALDHPTHSVEAALRYQCAGSSKKALILLVETIKRLELK